MVPGEQERAGSYRPAHAGHPAPRDPSAVPGRGQSEGARLSLLDMLRRKLGLQQGEAGAEDIHLIYQVWPPLTYCGAEFHLAVSRTEDANCLDCLFVYHFEDTP